MTDTANNEVTSHGRFSLTTQIFSALIAGVLVGVLFNQLDIAFINDHVVGGFLGMLGTIFLNALKMLVVPLVFFSLLCGVTGIGDISILRASRWKEPAALHRHYRPGNYHRYYAGSSGRSWKRCRYLRS